MSSPRDQGRDQLRHQGFGPRNWSRNTWRTKNSLGLGLDEKSLENFKIFLLIISYFIILLLFLQLTIDIKPNNRFILFYRFVVY